MLPPSCPVPAFTWVSQRSRVFLQPATWKPVPGVHSWWSPKCHGPRRLLARLRVQFNDKHAVPATRWDSLTHLNVRFRRTNNRTHRRQGSSDVRVQSTSISRRLFEDATPVRPDTSCVNSSLCSSASAHGAPTSSHRLPPRCKHGGTFASARLSHVLFFQN